MQICDGWTDLFPEFYLTSSRHNARLRPGFAEDGDQLPALNVFTRSDRRIHHFYNTELLYVPPEPGQDGRHVDMIWPLWNLFDLTPEGRGEDWYPKLKD